MKTKYTIYFNDGKVAVLKGEKSIWDNETKTFTIMDDGSAKARFNINKIVGVVYEDIK